MLSTVGCFCVLLIALSLASDFCIGLGTRGDQNGGLTYTREELLFLRPVSTSHLLSTVIPFDCPKQRKRGRRGGVRTRLRRRPTKPPLPAIVLANVQSLRNKMDELHANSRFDNVYREACIMAFSETWLNDSVPDDDIRLDGFTVFRAALLYTQYGFHTLT